MTAAVIDRMSEKLQATLEETKSLLLRKENLYEEELTYLSMVEILKRIRNGEENLYDPTNSGDRLALTLAEMHENDRENQEE